MHQLFGSRHVPHAALAALALVAAEPEPQALAQLRPPASRPQAIGHMGDPVLQLISSRPFLASRPQEQLSLLHSARTALVPLASDPQTPPLVARLILICGSPLYAKLEQADRTSVMRLAGLDIPTFERFFVHQATNTTDHQESRSTTGRLSREHLSDSTGESMFARLERLADTPITPLGCSGRLAARQLISVLTDPSTLRQHANTCFPTVLVHHLAATAPAEYVRLSEDLITRGNATTRCGLELSVHAAWLERYIGEPHGFPARNLLPWALFQALHARPLADPEREVGLAELPPGPDVARFIGCHTELRVRENPESWRAAPGDILFLVGNEQNQGHVLQLKALDGDYATVYDPAGPTSVRALVAAFLGQEACHEVDVSAPYARMPREILARITQTSYRFAPCAEERPCFALLRDERRVQVFANRAAVQRFIDETSETSLAFRRGRGLVPTLVVLAGMATLAVFRLLSRSRTP